MIASDFNKFTSDLIEFVNKSPAFDVLKINDNAGYFTSPEGIKYLVQVSIIEEPRGNES